MISSVMQHLKKSAGGADMVKVALIETAALTALDSGFFGGFGNSHSGAYRSPDGSYQNFISGRW